MIKLYYKTLLSAKDGQREGRALLSYALSMHGVDYAAEAKFKNGFGKEYLSSGALYYNVSHTKDLVCVTVCDSETGVDCETVREFENKFAIAKRFFTKREYEELAAAEDPLKTFFGLWTKKESYIKFLGKGFAVPLSSFDTADICDIQKTFEINGAICTVTAEGACDTEIINGDKI